jgi:hypothetical protein
VAEHLVVWQHHEVRGREQALVIPRAIIAVMLQAVDYSHFPIENTRIPVRVGDNLLASGAEGLLGFLLLKRFSCLGPSRRLA